MKSISRARSIRAFALGVGGWLAIAGCGEVTSGTGSESSGGGASAVQAEPDSAGARAVIDRLRARHIVREPVRFGRPGRAAITNGLTTPRLKPVLGASTAARFVRGQQGLQAKWTNDAPVEVWVPVRAADAFGLRDRTSGMTVSAKLAGARDAAAAVVEGIAVYEGAGPGGGNVIHRLTDAGTEDYVTFDARPETGALGYDLLLSGVAGLRLVANTLEFVDAAGSPRLRISPPYVVGGRGEVVAAMLSLSGCAADHDPSAPWDRPPVAPGSDRCHVDVRWDADSVSYPAIVDPSWGSTTTMGTGRTNFIGVTLANNKVLVAGGFSPQFAFLKTAELYNMITRNWASTGEMGEERAYHAAARRGVNGLVLVAGGHNSSGTLNSSESYSPSPGTWAPSGLMNIGREGHQLTRLNSGDVLASGGNEDSSWSAQRFIETTASWASAGDMKSTLIQHSATLLTDGRVLVVGGTPPAGQLYNPGSNSWTETPTQPEQRSAHAAARLTNGDVVVAGGYGPGGGVTAEVFNPGTNTWSRTGNLWQTHAYAAFGAGLGNRMLVAGDYTGNKQTNAEIFDGAWGTWRPGPPNPEFRQGAVSVPFPSGRVLIAGGTNSAGTVLTTAMEFDTASPAVTIGEYKYAVSVPDNDVLPGRTIELWASVHRPSSLPPGKLPLVILLAGNHFTCGHGSNPRIDDSDEYTNTGNCTFPNGPVSSHRGYDYIANELASRNYLVVSINANRGINYGAGVAGDMALIAARGRLVLKHLQKLSEWHRGVASPPPVIGSLAGKIDFAQVGLMGHSAGGDGVRSAHYQYKEPGSMWPMKIGDAITFRGIFEIAPSDFSEPPRNALSVRWNVLLPMCDGDIYHLLGVLPFDRMMALSETTHTPKSTYTVWGANHNFYNTQWQVSEIGSGCLDHTPMFITGGPAGVTGSAEQRQSGFQPMLAFFLANVGNTTAPVDPWFDNLFNPELAWSFRPRVDRGYAPASGNARSIMLEDFINATGTSSYGQPNVHNGVTVSHGSIPEHAPSPTHRGGDIAWSSSAVFQTNFKPNFMGLNLQTYQYLDLRVDRVWDTSRNTGFSTDFYIQLVNADNSTSAAVQIGNYISLVGPVGGGILPSRHSMLQTARIPLAAFTNANLSSIRGLKMTFSVPGSTSGHIYVANIRASKSTLAP
jgi:hypothetical protein